MTEIKCEDKEFLVDENKQLMQNCVYSLKDYFYANSFLLAIYIYGSSSHYVPT